MDTLTETTTAEMLQKLDAIDRRLEQALAGIHQLPADAVAAVVARNTAKARGFYYVADFATAIGRSYGFVSERCNARTIRTCKGGKPYRIPLSELDEWNTVKAD